MPDPFDAVLTPGRLFDLLARTFGPCSGRSAEAWEAEVSRARPPEAAAAAWHVLGGAFRAASRLLTGREHRAALFRLFNQIATRRGEIPAGAFPPLSADYVGFVLDALDSPASLDRKRLLTALYAYFWRATVTDGDAEMTKAELLAALACKPVPFDAGGGVVIHIRPLDLSGRLAVGGYAEAHPEASQAAVWALTFALAVCDESGGRLFPGDDAVALVTEVMAASINGGIVEAVARRVVELSKAPDPQAA